MAVDDDRDSVTFNFNISVTLFLFGKLKKYLSSSAFVDGYFLH